MNTASNPYVDQFLGLKCAPDYLAARLLPGSQANRSKELTEVMGAFAAVREAVGAPRFSDPNVLLLDVGCGVAPRAGALFALMTRWKCVGIDPALRRQARRVARLEAHALTFAQYAEIMPAHDGLVVVVAVHSHAPLDTVATLPAREVIVVAIPCCVPQVMPTTPTSERDDPFIMSEKRTVRVWNPCQAI